jgi:hypothetical protein
MQLSVCCLERQGVFALLTLQIVHFLINCPCYSILITRLFMLLKSLLGSLCLLSSLTFASQSNHLVHFSVSFVGKAGVSKQATLYSQLNKDGGSVYQTIDGQHNVGMTSALLYQNTLAIYTGGPAPYYQACQSVSDDPTLAFGYIRIRLSDSGLSSCQYHPYPIAH